MILGWLSPSGELVECDYMDHLYVADEIVEKYYKSEESIEYTDDFLLDNGWVHITMTLIGEHALRIFYKRLTDQQKTYLRWYAREYWDWISKYDKNTLIDDLDLEFEKVRFDWNV